VNENTNNRNNFIGYEYKDITVDREMESLYADGYQNFGWTIDSILAPPIAIGRVLMKFKRDRKIRNKAELTRLQRQFDACVNEIVGMEKSKGDSASIVAFTVGMIGTAFLAGATFSYLSGFVALCIILAIPGFIGWALPYYLYKATYAKKTSKVTPLIDSKYDEIYEICERANSLLGSQVNE
jgi:hypothetical protein